ncbi:MAG: DUF5658 family protein [bacterium]
MNGPRPVDRRLKRDRRNKPTSPLSISSITGSRRYSRRQEDQSTHHYVDRYSLRSALVVLCALLLSIFDAFFTLRLIRMGAAEINPIMDFLLQLGPLPFLLVKYFLTGSCLVWFLVHKNYYAFGGRLSVKYILLAILFLYSILIVYEIVLLNHIGP